MSITVQQQINIHSISIETIANSSVFQIGTSGAISTTSHVFEETIPILPGMQMVNPGEFFVPSLIPLPNPT